MFSLGFFFAAAGLLLAALAVPLIQRRIKPNPFYGFRVAQAYASEETWYEVNAYSGKWLLGAGLAIAAAALIFGLIPGLTLDTYAWLITGVAVAGLGIGLVQSWRYLHRIA